MQGEPMDGLEASVLLLYCLIKCGTFSALAPTTGLTGDWILLKETSISFATNCD